MKNQTNENNQKKENLERFVIGIGICIGFLSLIAWHGLKRIKVKSAEFIFLAPTGLMMAFYLAYNNYAHLRALHVVWEDLFTEKVLVALMRFSQFSHFVALFLIGGFIVLVALGFKTFLERRRLQKDLEEVGLKSAKGLVPKLISLAHLDNGKLRLSIRAKGVGVDRFEAKKGDLESVFESKVESIRPSKDRRLVEILLCKQELTKMLPYTELADKVTKPYNFPVGESANGHIVKCIRDLPHLLIAGVTGYGKSVFFKQTLFSLLKSKRTQVYLVDLKRVETKEFEPFPNVKIVKDELEAVQVLQALKDEMNRRYAYMEKLGVNHLEPTKHNRDLIVVAIDEASVLYGKTKVSKAKADLVATARELTHDLTKLARASGIHVIIATQKPVSESLDTSSLENLPGRMIFKMSSIPGSNTALGNKRAYELPDIKGRGIWRGGNDYIEVQTPYISPEELREECAVLAGRIKEDKNWNFQPLIQISSTNTKETQTFKKAFATPEGG